MKKYQVLLLAAGVMLGVYSANGQPTGKHKASVTVGAFQQCKDSLEYYLVDAVKKLDSIIDESISARIKEETNRSTDDSYARHFDGYFDEVISGNEKIVSNKGIYAKTKIRDGKDLNSITVVASFYDYLNNSLMIKEYELSGTKVVHNNICGANALGKDVLVKVK